jgi:hypothetical protein
VVHLHPRTAGVDLFDRGRTRGETETRVVKLTAVK